VSEQPRGTSMSEPRRVHPRVEWLAAYSWRFIVIGIVGLAGLWLIQRLAPVVIPIVVATFLTRLLTPISNFLRHRRWRPGWAAIATLLAFLVFIAGLSAVIVPSLADEAGTLGPTVTQAIDDVEDWLVEDSPFDVSRDAIDRLRERASDRLAGLFKASDGQVVDSAALVAEIVAGSFLALFLTFFMLRDGARLAAWVRGRIRPDRRETWKRAADRGWWTLGGYLRGAAALGAIESVTIGLALLLAGGSLVGPVMIVTFVAAFVPIVGAIVAGVIAVLVALVTGGLTTAAIVAVVAIVVQQLDNDLLAPLVYGRTLALHPAAVIVSVVAGGALFGVAGTLLAVPVVAVAFNVWRELVPARTEQE
jgi:putative heme transporter